MKIDNDLRTAINAAARVQPDMDWRQHRKDRVRAAETLLESKPALLRKIVAKRKAVDAASDKLQDARKALSSILDPMGVCYFDNEPTISSGDTAESLFEAAGGVIPREHQKWRADRVIARLAAAKPDERNAILKEYGIDWS